MDEIARDVLRLAGWLSSGLASAKSPSVGEVRLKGAFQSVAFRDDGRPESGRTIAPLRVRAVDEKDIPRRDALRVTEHRSYIASQGPFGVPVVTRPSVIKEIGHVGPHVFGKHGDPRDVHADIGTGVTLEDVVLNPTGSSPARMSGG